MRCLRRILQRPLHIFRDTNDELRATHKVHTIESVLVQHRVGLARRIVTYPKDHEATLALLFGTSQGAPHQAPTHPGIEQVRQDLLRLRRYHGVLTQPQTELQHLLVWLKAQPKSILKSMLLDATLNDASFTTKQAVVLYVRMHTM